MLLVARVPAPDGFLAGAAGGALAQDNPQGDGYNPLFPEAMYLRASPQQRREMEAAEARNRSAWQQRKQQEQAAAAAAQSSEQPPDQGSGQAPVAAPPPAAAPVTPRRKSKIYKWVDENGRVQFGDAPPRSGDAEEVKVRGTGASRPAAPASSGASGSNPLTPLVPGQRRR